MVSIVAFTAASPAPLSPHEPLAPAHVILRTQTHVFHHMGQLAAMCRLLGHPIPQGMDFPLAP